MRGHLRQIWRCIDATEADEDRAFLAILRSCLPRRHWIQSSVSNTRNPR